MKNAIFGLIFMVALLEQSQGADITENIWNGYNARKGQIPYQALLINKATNNVDTFCGGSLISRSHILTAAHCSYKTVKTRVYLGLTDTQDGNGVIYYDVSAANIFVHPSYNPKNIQNDISILKLPGAVTLTSQIQTIALPKKAWANPATFNNYAVTASGWGETQNNEDGIHRILQYRTVNKMPQSSCVNYFRTVNRVTNGMICTDKAVVYSGPCQGDSGGPLTVHLDSRLFLIGSVSWGVGDCSSHNPVVFTNIAYYLTWINYITGIPIN